MKQASRLLVLALSSLSLLASCGGDHSDSSSNPIDYSSSSSQEPITPTDWYFINDKQTSYKIVVSKDATDSDLYAASQIVEYTANLCGVDIETVVDDEESYSPNGHYIVIRSKNFEKSASFAWDNTILNGDGFVMWTHDKSLFLESNTNSGIVYASNQFIETYYGVDWLTPDYEYTPEVASTLPFLNIKRYYIPAFRNRNYLNYATYNNQAGYDVYSSHLRYAGEYLSIDDKLGGGIGWDTTFGRDHTALGYVDPKQFQEDPNDSTSLIKEEYRHIFSHDSEGNNYYHYGDTDIVHDNSKTDIGNLYDICWTDGVAEDGSLIATAENGTPTAAALAIESFKKILPGNKNKYFMFGQMDRGYLDMSPETQAVKARYGGFNSAPMIRFINCVAREVKKWADKELPGQEINIVMFAYSYSTYPPVKAKTDANGKQIYVNGKPQYEAIDESLIPEENVVIRVAPISAWWTIPLTDSRQSADMQTLFDRWGVLTDRFMVWFYQTDYSHLYSWYPTWTNLKGNIEMLLPFDLEYFFTQDSYTDKAEILQYVNAYIASKLIWDTSLNTSDILYQFIDRYFGPAANEAKKVFDNLTNRFFYCLSNQGESFLNWSNIRSASTWPYQLLEEQVNTLEESRAKIKNDATLTAKEKETYDEHLLSLELKPRYLILMNYTSYFGSDKIGLADFGESWCQDAETLGATNYAENKTIAQLRENGYICL